MATKKDPKLELLVYGYIRDIKKKSNITNIPIEINDMIYLLTVNG